MSNAKKHDACRHPMDECLRRGIIEEQHHEIAKRIRNYRDLRCVKTEAPDVQRAW
jgi:hypothetical protein